MATAEIRFDQGQVPTIACINQATVNLGVDFTQMVSALQKFLDEAFAPVWGTPAALKEAPDFLAGAWAIVFIDDADAEGALGYHDLTPDGLPMAKVFVKTALTAGEEVSVTASHELAEMLVDPAINLWALGPGGDFFAYETADAVEEETFPIDGVTMSDFVFPAYFESFRRPGSTQFDYLNRVSAPFELLPGGYSLVRDGCKFLNVFGSEAKEARFANEDRRGHRSQYRTPTHYRRASTAPARRSQNM